MEKSTEHSNKKSFLKEDIKDGISKHHNKYLGTKIPEGYFILSKISILDKIKEEILIEESKKTKKQLVFWMQPQFKFMAVATLVFILSLTVWLQNMNKTNAINETNLEFLVFSDDVLLESLLVDESNLDEFSDVILFNEILVKAELSEQKIDNLVLDNLILGDSLLDNYIEDGLIETIFL
ncbi:hypothetical protein [Polaribacter sp.]|uniref:hypothetical protein n=1 Tax=Polaribacter sp. TaxID=1920175 RepID=UPI002635B8D8|nr:hypothetical protein [Polaribacter sp.]MDG1404162.1 hypothetical protein [Polaribacter sp.]